MDGGQTSPSALGGLSGVKLEGWGLEGRGGMFESHFDFGGCVSRSSIARREVEYFE